MITTLKFERRRFRFWVLFVLLLVVFAMGGSTRNDVYSLAILSPLSFIFLGVSLASLRYKHLQQNKILCISFFVVFFITLFYLIPLPSSLFRSLPKQGDIVALVLDKVNLVSQWRPAVSSPTEGMQALSSLVIPTTIVLLGIQMDRRERTKLLPLLIGLVAASGLIGIFQTISDANGTLFFYSVTNNGSAVGLFANRNHAATLLACLFPMLAVYAVYKDGTWGNAGRIRQLLCLGLGMILVPLIMVTGSRAGLVVAIIGMLTGAVLYLTESQKDGGKKRRSLLLFCVIVLCLFGLTLGFSRATALTRFFGEETSESRSEFLLVSQNILLEYFPFGVGPGSFSSAYKVFEPARFLDPTYLNHAHNDWIETGVTFGLPGIVMLISLTIGYLVQTIYLWRQSSGITSSKVIGRMGGVVIGLIAISSLGDYPLRTPIIMSVFAICLIWFVPRHESSMAQYSRSTKNTSLVD